MIRLLQRLLGNRPAPTSRPENGPAPAAAAETARPTSTQGQEGAPRTDEAGQAAFEEAWGVLSGSLEPRPPGLPPQAADIAARLASQVMDHFSKNRPAPTAFPSLAVRIMDLLNEPDVDMPRLLEAIRPEPAISLNVLRVANSALYSRGAEVADMRTAVMRIGLRGVGEIAAGVAGRSLFDVGLRLEYEVFGNLWHELFLETMAVAFGASQLAFEQQVGRADRAFLAGMFHDIGRTLGLRSLASLMIAGEVPSPLPGPMVDAVLDLVHVEAGLAAHRIWGLPAYLQDTCARHHDAAVPDRPEDLELHILRMACGMHRLARDPRDPAHLQETRQSLEALRLGRRGAARFFRQMREQDERVRVLFAA